MSQLPYTGQAWSAWVISGISDDLLRREIAYWHAHVPGPYFPSMSLCTFYEQPNPQWDSFRLRNLDGGYIDHGFDGHAQYSVSSQTYRDAFQAQLLRAVDAGADGFHIDDLQGQLQAMVGHEPHSAGSFDSATMTVFRPYLQQKYTSDVLQKQFGIADIASFDFAAYIRTNGLTETWNKQPLSGLSQEFFSFLRLQTLGFLRDVISMTKQYAQRRYGRDFVFSGNVGTDPEGYYVRDVLDLTTAEPFYIRGSSTPFMSPNIKAWQGWKKPTIISPEVAISAVTNDPLTKPTVNMERVVLADIVASGGMPAVAPEMNWWLNPVPVDLAVMRRYANFMLSNPVLTSQMRAPARVALLESAGSVLGGMVASPGQTNPWAGRNNYTGLAKLLIDTGIAYDSVFLPDTSYSSLPPIGADLSRYSFVIAPSSWALDDSQVSTLLAYVLHGGTLIVIGDFGTNQQNGAEASRGQLAPLVVNAGASTYGAGLIVVGKELFGQEYLNGDVGIQRQARASFLSFLTPYVKPDVQVTQPSAIHYEPGVAPFLYHDRNGNALVHLVNYDYDLSSDQFYSKKNIGVTVRVGTPPVDEVILRSPDTPGAQSLPFTRNGDEISLTVPQVDAWVVLTFQQNATAPVIRSVMPAATLGAVGGSTLSFSLQADDADGNPLTYTWSVDGQVATDTFGPAYSLQLPLTASGVHTVTVTITDGSRVTQTSWAINVAAYRPPRVLFDESHAERNTIDPARASQLDPQHPSWALCGILNQTLQSLYQVSSFTTGPITAQVLTGADVLVLAAPDTALTSAENLAIANFVQAGGGLIFLGDAGLNTSINSLIGPWGILFDSTNIGSPENSGCAGCFYLSSFADHPAIGTNPSFYTNYGGSFSISQGGTALGQTTAAEWRSLSGQATKQPGDPNGPFSMIAVSQAGSGRVFAVSDNSFHDGYLQYSSNAGNLNLFLSALRWLTAPLNAPPNPPLTGSSVTSVLNAATFQPGFSSASWVSVKGTNLAPTTRVWGASDFAGNKLPTQLDGVSVNINGKPAYIYYISPTQINVLAPDDPALGEVSVEVVTLQGRSAPVIANKRALSPAWFRFDAGGYKYIAAVHTDGAYLGKPTLYPSLTMRTAKPGDIVLLYGTGFGPTNPSTPASELVTQPGQLTTTPVTVRIGGVVADVGWAGLVGSGLYQFNVTVPNVPDGDQPVIAQIGEFQTLSDAFITVQR